MAAGARAPSQACRGSERRNAQTCQLWAGGSARAVGAVSDAEVCVRPGDALHISSTSLVSRGPSKLPAPLQGWQLLC